jgi:hypothetical protein
MDNQIYNSIVSFIWGIADDCLRDVYVRGKYRDVILPMTVIRRLDAVLEETKPAVLEMKKKLDKAGITNQTAALCNAAGQSFCNSSPFCLRDLTSRAKKQTLKADFIAYLDGFSPNVQEILDKFKFRNQIDTKVKRQPCRVFGILELARNAENILFKEGFRLYIPFRRGHIEHDKVGGVHLDAVAKNVDNPALCYFPAQAVEELRFF